MYSVIYISGSLTQKLAESQLTIMCKLAVPQHREFRSEILQTMQVGVGRRNKFCENIISVPLPPIFKYTLAEANDKNHYITNH
ncbi:hypothetical protein DVJ86_05355 [Staphylococcus aureus]|nr:hypothetical protein [Staphylococcus aureus]